MSYTTNISAAIIDILAIFKLVSQRKIAPKEIVENLAINYGDDTHHYYITLGKIYRKKEDIRRLFPADARKSGNLWGYGE